MDGLPTAVEVEARAAQVRPGMRLETVRLIELLKKGTIGDTLTDEQLTKACGQDTRVGQKGYPYLRSATNNVLNNPPYLVWQRVTGAGIIKCLGPTEVAGVADATRRSTLKREKRAVCQMRAVYDEGTDQEKRALSERIAIHSTLAAFSTGHTAKKLAARNFTEAPDPARLLEAIVAAKSGS